MTRLETRELAYFRAVGEELHVGRAAQRLGIAQPALSRAVQGIERRLGVALLDRTGRGVTLTPAGAVLLRECATVLEAVDAAARRAQHAGRPSPTLRLAMKPEGDAGLLDEVLPLHRGQAGAVPIEVLLCGTGEQTAMLRDGRADVALLSDVHDDTTGLDVEVLLALPQVALVFPTHPLARRGSLVLADLHEDPLPLLPVPGDPVPRDAGQLVQLVAMGQAVGLVPRSVSDHARDDLVAIPVLDAPAASFLLGWPEGSRSPALAAFVRACTTVAGRRAAVAEHAPAPRSTCT